jgi:hypothetical protein
MMRGFQSQASAHLRPPHARTLWSSFFVQKDLPPSSPVDPIETSLLDTSTRGSFALYPVSRLAPKIVPQDLTNFKTRGITRIERELQQEMVELQERYMEVIDAFNWNKLIYEAQLGFEPVCGELYHLYDVSGKHHLSMIEPAQWHQRWLGSFRLNADGRWQVEKTAQDFDIRQWVSTRIG